MNKLSKTGGRSSGLSPWLHPFFDPDNFWNRDFPGFTRSAQPAVNISEDDHAYNVEMVVPGFRKEDIKVDVDNDVLTISAERSSTLPEGKDNKQYSRREYSYSSFSRSFTLPQNAKDDAIKAAYRDGILTIDIPKSSRDIKATKQIAVE